MGQSNSTEAKPVGEEQASGVSLAPELEADIVRDFQSQSLQEEWNKFGMSVLSRRNERLQRLHAAVTENQQKRHVEAAARQQRMTSIDTAIDQMQAEIADQTISIDYDASQLLKKFGYMTAKANDDVEKESKPLPCLGQRAHWIDCQRKYAADSRPCNFYVAALEECVTRTIGNSALAAAGAKT